MTTRLFNISSNSDGTFIVDENGIYSTEPIDIKSIESSNNGINIIGNHSFTFSSGNGKFNFCGNSMFNISSNSNIIINGVKITQQDVENIRNKNKDTNKLEIFNYKWNEHKFDSPPIINNITITGSSKFHIKLPLSNFCIFKISGSGTININSNNLNTHCEANISGSGNVKGNNSLKSINANVSGSGNINGFSILNNINANVSGSGNIKLKADNNCRITKNVSGSGNINIFYQGC
jgi:hypothetical protein